jgi:hypothetical protein
MESNGLIGFDKCNGKMPTCISTPCKTVRANLPISTTPDRIFFARHTTVRTNGPQALGDETLHSQRLQQCTTIIHTWVFERGLWPGRGNGTWQHTQDLRYIRGRRCTNRLERLVWQRLLTPWTGIVDMMSLLGSRGMQIFNR